MLVLLAAAVVVPPTAPPVLPVPPTALTPPPALPAPPTVAIVAPHVQSFTFNMSTNQFGLPLHNGKEYNLKVITIQTTST